MSTSANVTAGNNAKASEYNDLRTDAITRYIRYVFEVKGTLVTGNTQGPRYLVPASQTVTKIKTKLEAGTATVRIKKDSTDVKAGVSVTSTAADDSTITSPSLTENQVLTLDITAVSSASDLIVEVFATETI